MSFDDAIDQTKQWFNDRLNSPYFASACAVWIVSNISVFFGIFNFHEDMTVDCRLKWVKDQAD